ncbi:MAG: hypothetical protein A2Y10_08645 [Planctomycetes bacterium GWF2_41_51]|nr:MAG: hypothetical protein A2Y10_08645 [Planctomycetes bacterium GWF2_41_51]HBG28601.1 hypothetical protein [Phycisphaerales bacterium]
MVKITEEIMEKFIAIGLADEDEVAMVVNFQEAGMLTRNSGLVVRTIDGSEFQITIVQSR